MTSSKKEINKKQNISIQDHLKSKTLRSGSHGDPRGSSGTDEPRSSSDGSEYLVLKSMSIDYDELSLSHLFISFLFFEIIIL